MQAFAPSSRMFRATRLAHADIRNQSGGCVIWGCCKIFFCDTNSHLRLFSVVENTAKRASLIIFILLNQELPP